MAATRACDGLIRPCRVPHARLAWARATVCQHEIAALRHPAIATQARVWARRHASLLRDIERCL